MDTGIAKRRLNAKLPQNIDTKSAPPTSENFNVGISTENADVNAPAFDFGFEMMYIRGRREREREKEKEKEKK